MVSIKAPTVFPTECHKIPCGLCNDKEVVATAANPDAIVPCRCAPINIGTQWYWPSSNYKPVLNMVVETYDAGSVAVFKVSKRRQDSDYYYWKYSRDAYSALPSNVPEGNPDKKYLKEYPYLDIVWCAVDVNNPSNRVNHVYKHRHVAMFVADQMFALGYVRLVVTRAYALSKDGHVHLVRLVGVKVQTRP